jgi:hypothetical protein
MRIGFVDFLLCSVFLILQLTCGFASARALPGRLNGGSASSVAAAPPATTAAQEERFSKLSTSLEKINQNISALAEKSGKPDRVPAYLACAGALVGVLIGGCITVFTQRRLLAYQTMALGRAETHSANLAEAKFQQDRELARARAQIEIGNSFVQWQLKQLSELYGPLHALLRQSSSLYRHMNRVLVKADPQKFSLAQGAEGEDFDNQIFKIYLNGAWVDFKTILHLEHAYARRYGIEPYFDEVVAIGARMVAVIEGKAGYVRPEQKDLVQVFGKYLAHFRVLERLHAAMKARQQSVEHGNASSISDTMGVDESAVFPKEIQGLVDKGFEALNKELSEWRLKGAP